MAAPSAEILRITTAAEAPARDWESKLDLIKRTVAAGASPDELELFLYQCKRTGLDPLARQIYYVKRQGKGVTQVGIDGLRLIADRTGLYAGNDDADFIGVTDSGHPAKTRVTVYKMVQGQRCAFTATARWDEYYPGDAQGFQWRKMPHAMLAKCAEALALRKAFPADMSGLYVHEEMEQADRPLQDPQQPVEGEQLAESLNKAFDSSARKSASAVAPDGKDAFGYAPIRWPLPKMFGEPATPSQEKMMLAKADERHVPSELLADVKRLVLEAYGLEDEATKASASLFIDWLLNADDGALDTAIDAAGKTEPAQSVGS